MDNDSSPKSETLPIVQFTHANSAPAASTDPRAAVFPHLLSPAVRESANALRAAAHLAGAPAFAPPLPALPVSPSGAPARGSPVQELPDRGLGQRALDVGLVVAHHHVALVGEGGGRGGGVGGRAPRAGAHGLGDDLELVGAGLVVLLLVLHAAVVLEEELARLLQHPAALADGTTGATKQGGDSH